MNLKASIQGCYQGGGFMANVLHNQGITGIAGTECDTITVQLRLSSAPYTLVSESKSILQTNGQLIFSGTAVIGQSYFVVLKHRHAIETWSVNTVLLSGNTTYDFTTGANKAYGDNQIEIDPGVWALYSGDIVIDGNVDLLDLGLLENDINNFEFGYFASDLNGDGNVDLLDAPIMEANINAFVFSSHP